MASHKDLIIVPDPITLWVHNVSALRVVALIAGLIMIITLLTGHYVASAGAGFVFAMSMALQPLLCGWVHNFAAYSMATEDPAIQVKQ